MKKAPRILIFTFTGVFGLLVAAAPALAYTGTQYSATVSGGSITVDTAFDTYCSTHGSNIGIANDPPDSGWGYLHNYGQPGIGTYNVGTYTFPSAFPHDPGGMYNFMLQCTGTGSFSDPGAYILFNTSSGSVVVSNPPPGNQCLAGNQESCIATVVPADDPSILDLSSSTQAIATSSAFAFGSSGYILPTDLGAGTYVEQLYQPDDFDQVAAAVCAIGGCRTKITYPISASGMYTVSSTTSINREGNYTMTTNVVTPVQVNVFNFFTFNLPFADHTVVSTTTNFQVGQPSQLDIVKGKLGAQYVAVGITNHATSTVATLVSGCAFTSITQIFDLTSANNIFACVTGFVAGSLVPTGQQLEAVNANLQASVLTRPPFGYVTRMTTIISGQTVSTSSLPDFIITVPPILGLGSETATFPLWTNLMGSTSPFGMATSSVARGSKTFRQIVEPGWNTIVLTILALLMLWDILRIKH